MKCEVGGWGGGGGGGEGGGVGGGEGTSQVKRQSGLLRLFDPARDRLFCPTVKAKNQATHLRYHLEPFSDRFM